MGKVIYLISALSRVGVLMVFATAFFAVFVVFTAYVMLIEYGSVKRAKEEGVWKLFIGLVIGALLSAILSIAIPSKEEMYMMALTKDYEIEDVYQMSKSEIKSIIDYAFEKLDDLEN